MEVILIDTMGAGLGLFATLMLFETFWVKKNIKHYFFIWGILLNAFIGIVLSLFLQNTLILPTLIIALNFALSFFYSSKITYKLLLTFIITAIAFIAEMLVGFILVQALSISLEEIQTSVPTYMFGVLASNLFTLFVVFMIRVFMKGRKQAANSQFNLLMALMPVQAIILCYIVVIYSFRSGTEDTLSLGIAAIFLSIFLIVVTMIILDKQRMALLYKREYELSQSRLKLQIEHYQEMYQEQQRVKTIRHDINNTLIAISGMLNAGQMQNALDRISLMCDDVKKAADIVNTGLPPIDAILSAKISKAKDSGIDVKYSIIIDDQLFVDQFDIAVILANALDNAIEGTVRSDNVDGKIVLVISRVADYISILIDNNTTGPIHDDYQTTKLDWKNHGFGMAQMRDVVKKYNGSFYPLYNPKESKFSLKIMLTNRQH